MLSDLNDSSTVKEKKSDIKRSDSVIRVPFLPVEVRTLRTCKRNSRIFIPSSADFMLNKIKSQ